VIDRLTTLFPIVDHVPAPNKNGERGRREGWHARPGQCPPVLV